MPLSPSQFLKLLRILGAVVFVGNITASGLVLPATYDQSSWHNPWLAWGLGLFTISGIIRAAILIPIQIVVNLYFMVFTPSFLKATL